MLAPYDKIKRAYEYITKNPNRMKQECFTNRKKSERRVLYQRLYAAYSQVSRDMVGEIKMNVRLVQGAGLTVCPYCGRDYINCRAKNHAGAQLDHFYSRSIYPVFSVCLYNLVPSCGVCNHIKTNNLHTFVSPFDEEIDWESGLQFSYKLLEDEQIKIIISAEEPVKSHIEALHLDMAYQIHDVEVNELIYKRKIYSNSQLEEFRKLLGEEGLTESEMKRIVFGPPITKQDMKTKPLGRMLRDLERQLDIYE